MVLQRLLQSIPLAPCQLDKCATPAALQAYNVKLRLGQQGALLFIDFDVTELLEEWNVECGDFSYNSLLPTKVYSSSLLLLP
jgi:hypothetical protein